VQSAASLPPAANRRVTLILQVVPWPISAHTTAQSPSFSVLCSWMERWPHRRRRGGAVNRARGRSLAGARRVHGSGGLVGRTHEPHAELHCRRLMWAPAGREQRSVRPPELTRRPCLLLGPRWCWCPGAPALASSSPKKTCSHESGHKINKTKCFML
jgi:hypothetical protein